MHLTSTTAMANKPGSIIPGALSLILSAFTFLVATPLSAQAPSLGTAERFAVLAGSTLTNTGPSTITGDVGVSSGTAITGFPPGIITGTVYSAGAVAAQAQLDSTAAYIALANAPCTVALTGQDLGGLTLTPGVYCFTSSAQLTGALTLDGLGTHHAVFIFQIGTTLTTASGSSVNLINGAKACSVYWQIGTSATLGSGTDFTGTMIALTSITLASGTTMSGKALARNGAVTLSNTDIVNPALASWNTFGVGWPGTSGIPSLTLSAPPVIGTTINMIVQNVYGPVTQGFLVWGLGPASIPTPYGGVLQVLPACGLPIGPIGPGLHSLSIPIPPDVSLICVEFWIQILQLDPNASHGIAFSGGLHMTLGL